MIDRRQIVLAALAPGHGVVHSPVQIQKLLFLVDREVAGRVGGPFFDFRPYNYGPFDKAVYSVLEELAADGLAEAVPLRSWSGFRLTDAGQRAGEAAISALPAPVSDYIKRASEFVRTHSFATLVSAIYRTYPDMKVNSIFQS